MVPTAQWCGLFLFSIDVFKVFPNISISFEIHVYFDYLNLKENYINMLSADSIQLATLLHFISCVLSNDTLKSFINSAAHK